MGARLACSVPPALNGLLPLITNKSPLHGHDSSGRPPSCRDERSGFPLMHLRQNQGYFFFLNQHTQAGCVTETLWSASRWHRLKRDRESVQMETVDLAASSKSCCLDRSLAAAHFLFHRAGCCSGTRLISILLLGERWMGPA